ncbi:LysR family transcriptional regulator [Nioella aestuarii]|uniref:LysR family transcriptional regulator n=1 Tax=Nioella aestuarii TaxID=1662864 RepID=UPI003D7F6E96
MQPSALPPLGWLRAFEAAARHLSFTQAAVELNLTQSAISQHVRNLEGFLGRELFIRRTRSLMLTEAGYNYLPIVREAFDILATGTRSFVGGTPQNTLNLQCNLAFSTFWLAPRIAKLKAAHPWLTLNLVTPIWDPEKFAHTAAVEIRFGRLADMPASAQILSHDHVFPVCAPGYADGKPDWRRDPLFECGGIMSNWDYWLAGQGQVLPPGQQVTISSSYSFSLSVARSGGGLAMGHETLCGTLLETGELIRPFPHQAELLEAYFLIAPPDLDATRPSRAFCDWLMDEISR